MTTILIADTSVLRVTSRRSTISATMIPDEVRDAGVEAVRAFRDWTARQQAPKFSFESVSVETLAATGKRSAVSLWGTRFWLHTTRALGRVRSYLKSRRDSHIHVARRSR